MKELSLQDFHCNPFDLFGRDWMALTAGAAPEHFNSLTIAWGHLGSHSGKDGRKMEAAGLTPVFSDGTAYFAEADLVFICRKLYCGALNEGGFADMALVDFNYPEKGFHTMYVGEIIKVLGA